jgi:hypothetical protein
LKKICKKIFTLQDKSKESNVLDTEDTKLGSPHRPIIFYPLGFTKKEPVANWFLQLHNQKVLFKKNNNNMKYKKAQMQSPYP